MTKLYYGYWYKVGKEWKWTEKLVKDNIIKIPEEHVKSVTEHGVVYLRRK